MKTSTHPPKFRLVLIVLIACFFACKKENHLDIDNSSTGGLRKHTDKLASTQLLNDADTVPIPMVLGAQLPNPFLVPNMKQAYKNITGQNSTPAVTNLYVRFLPANLDQLLMLDSVMRVQNLELFDYPLDYQVISEGDYYQDPGIPLEQITWLYAVVPQNFSFPSGISNQTLASIQLTDNLAVEQEAERLAGLNADGDGLAILPEARTVTGNNKGKKKPVPYTGECLAGYHWDNLTGQCVADNCPEGYRWNSNTMQCEPLPPSPDPTFYPAGKIRVRDTQIPTQPGGEFLHPVRNLKLLAYRWFRLQNTSTDDLGNFTITKNFRRKVKLKAKFINQYCTVRGIRGARLWEMLLPIAPLIGKYTSDDIHNVDHFFDQNIDTRSRGMRNWTAATTFNAVQEHREYATNLTLMLHLWA